MPPGLVGRRPGPAGGLAGYFDRDPDRDDLDFAADTVARLGGGTPPRSGGGLDELMAAIRVDRIVARW